MANITVQDVEKTAKLAKLELSHEEAEIFTKQFAEIVGFVEKIAEIETSDVPPTTHAVEKRNVLREDVVKTSMPVSEIEAVAPKAYDGYIVVPRIIEY
jgi:aspartyl-tRNA(Asn)/glutamyl-tRNA(Gln) amidotransferase subunit C